MHLIILLAYLAFGFPVIRAKTAIIRRLSQKMSIVHPWMVCFDLPMAHEVSRKRRLLVWQDLGLKGHQVQWPEWLIHFQSWDECVIYLTSSRILVGLESNMVKVKERQFCWVRVEAAKCNINRKSTSFDAKCNNFLRRKVTTFWSKMKQYF